MSFKGTARFRKNVANLGGFMRNIQLEITSFDEQEDRVETEWRFSCTLALPWRPQLKAAGGTTHVFGTSGLVEKHIERWAIDPSVVVKQLFTPGK